MFKATGQYADTYGIYLGHNIRAFEIKRLASFLDNSLNLDVEM